MILSTIQLYALAGSVLYFLLILWNVRQRRISEAYALLWIISAILMITVSIWTECLEVISDLIGIAYPPATLFLLLLCCMILVLFQYSVILTKNQKRISRLAQEVALLKEEMEKMKVKNEDRHH